MKKLTLSSLVLILLLLAPAGAQIKRTTTVTPNPEDEAPTKLSRFQMVIFTKGAKWATTSNEERGRIFKQHLENSLALYEDGKLAIAGPFGDDTDLVGIFVFRTGSAEDAKMWTNTDPAVAAGLLKPEMHPWWSQDIFKKAK